MKRFLILAAAVLFSAGLLNAQTLGKDARYCNPLPMEVGQKSDTSTISFEEILGVRVRAEE